MTATPPVTGCGSSPSATSTARSGARRSTPAGRAVVFGTAETASRPPAPAPSARQIDRAGSRRRRRASSCVAHRRARPRSAPPEQASCASVQGTLTVDGAQPRGRVPRRTRSDAPRACNRRELDSVRGVSGWFEPDRGAGAAGAAARAAPRATNRIVIAATLFEPEGWIRVEEPRLSTTYRRRRPPRARRAWSCGSATARSSIRGARPPRRAGPGRASTATASRLQVTPLRCHSRRARRAGRVPARALLDAGPMARHGGGDQRFRRRAHVAAGGLVRGLRGVLGDLAGAARQGDGRDRRALRRQSAVRARDRAADASAEFLGLARRSSSPSSSGGRSTLDGFGERYFANLTPNEPVIDYMRELRGRGYRLAICTNNVREWEARWRAMLPVDEIFDVVVDSAFVGTRKPERRIYELTLERLGVAARGGAAGRRHRGQLRRRPRARDAGGLVSLHRAGDRGDRSGAAETRP